MRNLRLDPTQRWDVMGEHLAAMREIWTHDEAEYHGRFVDFDPIWMWPKPVQAPHPPLLVGGSGPRSLRLAVEYGDGWMPIVSDLQELDVQLAELRAGSDAAGRPALPVTACFDELDEELIVGCVERGVVRYVVVAPPEHRTGLQTFLDSYRSFGDRLT
jgi:alkanesulfonate monooxygenase SsuD/methylene tetrahydromethanopterin reductase-like flavin-dependent oxidoreductase (luciferase family)